MAKQENDNKKFFIIARGLDLDDKHQLVQFIVPGFNMIKSVKCSADAGENEIDDYLNQFQLEVSGLVEDWKNALDSNDNKLKQQFPDQQTYDACWMVNQAVEETIHQVAGDSDDT